jgi:hypothetical protein
MGRNPQGNPPLCFFQGHPARDGPRCLIPLRTNRRENFSNIWTNQLGEGEPLLVLMRSTDRLYRL